MYFEYRSDTHEGRLLDLKNWKENGGVCIINYELFRILVEDGTKHTKQFPLKYKEKYQQYLLNPGTRSFLFFFYLKGGMREKSL